MTFRRPVGPTYFSLWLSDGLTWAPESVVAPKPLAAVFTKGGVAVARTSERRMASYALLDNGPTRAGHAHKNNLTIHYEAFGLPVVVDPGRAIYRPDADRSWVTACESHNTLFIEDTPIRAGERIPVPALHIIPFPGDPRLGEVSVEESDRFFLLRSRFSGYAPEPGASVLRSVFLGRDETAPWLAVVDEIISPTEHTWTNSWLLPSSEAVATIEGGFRLRLDNGLFVHLRVCAGGPLDLRDDAMFWCPQYGEKSPARWVRFSRRCAAERRVAMLVPARESNGSVNARFAALEAALRSVP